MEKKFKILSNKQREKWVLSTKNDLQQKISSSFHIELEGKHELTLEGCLGVYEYRNDFIKLRIKNGFTVITGHDFDIINFEGSSITVKGVVLAIELSD